MAHLSRPTYTQPIPSKAVVRVVKGVKVAIWTMRGGRKVEAPVSEDEKRCTVQSPRWRGYYKDHAGNDCEVTLFEDRDASWRRLLEITRRERDIRAGNLSPAAARREGKTLTALLNEWEQAIRDGGSSDKQAAQSRRRVDATCEAAGVIRPADLTPGIVATALAGFRRAGVPRLEGNRQRPKPLSARTSNHFLRACKAFTGWATDAGYLEADPLARAAGIPVDGRATFTRRALTVAELEQLMDATARRPARCSLAGPDRAMVYYVAFYTGFRLNELAVLRPEDFRVDGGSPCVVLSAKSTKNKKEARQYLPAHVADRLTAYLAGKGGGPVWGHARNFFGGLKAAGVLRRDLAAAGIPFETADGRVDFHAIRASYITALAVAGVPLAHAQKMARHSDPRLTSNVYSRLTDADLAGAAAKLPPPGPRLG
jgi:integrase/recombinase XerD